MWSVNPKAEVDLCGHATLASAHVLWERGEHRRDEAIAFFTNSGVLTAINNDGWIRLDFPNETPVRVESPPAALVGALPAEPLFIGRNRFDYLVEIGSEQEVRRLTPDFRLLQEVDARGIIVTSRSAAEEVDFVSRAVFSSSRCAGRPGYRLRPLLPRAVLGGQAWENDVSRLPSFSPRRHCAGDGGRR